MEENRRNLNRELEEANQYLKYVGLADTKRRVEVLHELSSLPEGKIMPALMQRVTRWITSEGEFPQHDEALVATWIEDLPAKAPDNFLKEASTLKGGTSLRPGPEQVLSTMTARPMDFGLLPHIARDTRRSLEWLPLLRAILVWLLVYLMIVLGYPLLFGN